MVNSYWICHLKTWSSSSRYLMNKIISWARRLSNAFGSRHTISMVKLWSTKAHRVNQVSFSSITKHVICLQKGWRLPSRNLIPTNNHWIPMHDGQLFHLSFVRLPRMVAKWRIRRLTLRLIGSFYNESDVNNSMQGTQSSLHFGSSPNFRNGILTHWLSSTSRKCSQFRRNLISLCVIDRKLGRIFFLCTVLDSGQKNHWNQFYS